MIGTSPFLRLLILSSPGLPLFSVDASIHEDPSLLSLRSRGFADSRESIPDEKEVIPDAKATAPLAGEGEGDDVILSAWVREGLIQQPGENTAIDKTNRDSQKLVKKVTFREQQDSGSSLLARTQSSARKWEQRLADTAVGKKVALARRGMRILNLDWKFWLPAWFAKIPLRILQERVHAMFLAMITKAIAVRSFFCERIEDERLLYKCK